MEMQKKVASQNGNVIIKILIIILLLACFAIGGYLGWKFYQDKQTKPVNGNETIASNDIEQQEPEKTIEIFKGDERPIACMIDNHSDAWPQFSINKAYLVYEIIVEGGETRLMALFKGSDAQQVGPMRSSRHYFLDYALENDAIYAHIGWSPQAESDIKKLGVNNVNGLYYDTNKSWKEGDVFWRIYGNYKAPHNSICSLSEVKNAAEKLGYRTTSTDNGVLNYVTDEITLEDHEDVANATNVIIPFSTLQTVNFKYDQETGNYIRYARNKLQNDATTSESIKVKNIIITKAENYTLSDADNKGRQGLKNIGTKDGYYITNGKAIPITCTKDSRSSKTIYKDSTGKEIDVNDGNTFIEICPINSNLTIE